MAVDKQVKGFKRINFFKGFLTTENDWNDAERYHVEKRKLHNKLLHAPGVALGYMGDLRVVARARGDLAMEIQPGYAIDAAGNDLVLWDAVIKTIVPEEYKLPQTLYVVLRFVEELSDFIAYKENLEYKGHRRVHEQARVELSQTPPDITKEVELARLVVEKGAQRIRDARDPLQPQANEIDMRFVPKAGIAGAQMQPDLRARIFGILNNMRKTFMGYCRMGVISAHDALQATNTAIMLERSDMLDMRNLFEVMTLVVEMEAEMALDVEVNHPVLSAKKEFNDYKKNVEILRGLLGERKSNAEAFQNLCAYQQKATDIANAAISGESRAVVEEPKKKEEKKEEKKATTADWESVKTMSSGLNDAIQLENRTWTLIDQIEILDQDSEAKHGFEIKDAKDSYRTRQKQKYPDGVTVEDTGRAHIDGHAVFKILNVTPGKEVAIVRRMDYVYGDYEIEYKVDGKVAGVDSCTGRDKSNRWRNWTYVIPAEFVKGATITVQQSALTAGRDVNMFHFWFYQPK